MSAIDIAILIPVIPLFPFVVTWWLPWEKWIPWGNIPKRLAAPYLFYVAFTAWHFHMDWWFIALIVFLGGVASAQAMVEYRDRYRRDS